MGASPQKVTAQDCNFDSHANKNLWSLTTSSPTSYNPISKTFLVRGKIKTFQSQTPEASVDVYTFFLGLEPISCDFPGVILTVRQGATPHFTVMPLNGTCTDLGLAESCMQATESHLLYPLQDIWIWSADCPRPVGAKGPHYPVGRTGCCRYPMKAKARGQTLLQKVILIDKAPCGLAVDC